MRSLFRSGSTKDKEASGPALRPGSPRAGRKPPPPPSSPGARPAPARGGPPIWGEANKQAAVQHAQAHGAAIRAAMDLTATGVGAGGVRSAAGPGQAGRRPSGSPRAGPRARSPRMSQALAAKKTAAPRPAPRPPPRKILLVRPPGCSTRTSQRTGAPPLPLLASASPCPSPRRRDPAMRLPPRARVPAPQVDLSQPIGQTFNRDLKVTKVHPGGQAEAAGINNGSIALAVAGNRIKNVVDFQLEMRRCQFNGDSHCEVRGVLVAVLTTRSARCVGSLCCLDDSHCEVRRVLVLS